jgi:PAS domain S-box-containing protein
MREKLLTGIREINTWVFTGIAVLFAVVLTTGLNSFFVWVDGGRYNPRIFMYATIDAILIPLIIAPIMVNAFKRVLNLEQANQLLQGQLEERQRAHKVAEQRVANLQAISGFAIACSAASPDQDLYKLIAEKLHDITGALGVAVSEYDSKEKALITRYVSVSGQALSTMNNILGRNVIGLRSPVKPETLEYILSSVVAVASDMTEVSFGAIPKSISAIAQSVFGLGSFTGLAFTYGGELWGTAMIVMQKDQLPIDQDLAMALANVAAMAMRRQKTEEALQASEARYRTLVEILPDSVTLSDLAGNIIYCNQQMAALHGYENVDQIPGNHILGHFAPEEHARVLEYIQNALLLQHLDDTPFTLMKQDGSRFPGEIRACLVPGKDGNPTGIIGITRDIAGRKKAESEREMLIHELQSKNKELEQFTYTVSHDLKAPIITIKGFLGLLQKDIGENRRDRIQSDIQRIDEAADRMHNLLTELLELSRIGRMMNPPQKVAFADLVQEALTTVRGRLDTSRVQITVQPDLPTVYGDRQRLVEVLQNLLDNAAKFMGEQPEPMIEIGCKEQDGKSVFFVRDNGIGIDPQFHEQVFGLFNKLNPNMEGTGVGLALVKRIIEVHNGKIWVESQADKGAAFCFTLPAGE